MRIGRYACIGVALVALCACNNDSHNNLQSSPHVVAKIAIPNIGSSSNFSFDLGDVDTSRELYYFTDRNNKSVDVIDLRTNTLVRQIGGFAGCNTGPTCAGANNEKGGPNGINVIPGTNFVYVGDVNAVRIIDTNSFTVVKTINVGGNSGLRADEGCYDPDHNLYMISSPGESPPFATFIDTTTQKVIATLLFTDPGSGASGPASAGLEACVYDHATASFYVNNDGSSANPRGEVDVVPAAAILAAGSPAAPAVLTIPAITPGSGWKVFPEGNCDPTGIALGPDSELAVSCRQGVAGEPLTMEFFNKVTGAMTATINAGGGDQLWYDATTNRYFLAASRWTQNGKSSGPGCGGANAPCTPTLFIIDGTSHAILASLTTGNNAHSVAFDPVTREVLLPYSSAGSPAGCLDCSQNPEGGVLVFTMP